MMQWLLKHMGYTKRSGTSHPEQWLIDWVSGGAEASSGVSVTASKALKYTPFWAAVRIISGTLASLPFKVYRRLDNGGRQSVGDHPVYELIHERPNEYMDWVTFAETRQAHVLCYGNGFAEIQRDGAGRPVALWPLLPDRTSRRMGPDGLPYYEVRMDKGGTVTLPDANVLHVKGLGFDGYTGYDVVSYHKEAIGYGMAVKEFGSRFFGNDASPGGHLEHPGALSESARKHLRESLEARHQSLSDKHRMEIFEEGMKWVPNAVEPSKAQALETQKFTVDDCARIFQIPPHKLQSMEFSKYSNVADLNNDFYCSAMLYWFRKWEQEINYKLLMPSERAGMFCEILVDALLRGDTASRTAFYAGGRQWGYLSINDIRAKENLNPIGPAGDIYLDPLNMTPAGTLRPPEADPAPSPPAEGDSDPEDEPDNDAVRTCHLALLAGQWRRIITKQNAAASQWNVEQWIRHRAWVRELLTDAANACAAQVGISPSQVQIELGRFIEEHVHTKRSLSLESAESLAGALMETIGGKHDPGCQ